MRACPFRPVAHWYDSGNRVAGDLDRALLLDLSARLDRYDVEDQLRFVLRDHFWELVGEITR